MRKHIGGGVGGGAPACVRADAGGRHFLFKGHPALASDMTHAGSVWSVAKDGSDVQTIHLDTAGLDEESTRANAFAVDADHGYVGTRGSVVMRYPKP